MAGLVELALSYPQQLGEVGLQGEISTSRLVRLDELDGPVMNTEVRSGL